MSSFPAPSFFSRSTVHHLLVLALLSAALTAMLFLSHAHVTALSLLSLTVGYVAAAPTGHVHYSGDNNNSSAVGRRGAVSSESALCSRIGTDILKQGGNAADAMVASVFCTGVVGMYHSGIGGGGFAVVRSSNGSYEFIDFREAAPMATNETIYVGNVQGSLTSGLASGVPGEVRGLEYIHTKYGRLPWEKVVMPAVKVARYGFPVTEDLLSYIASASTSNVTGNFLVNDPSWALDFAPNGTILGLGETLTRRRYADTLETIARKGPNAFYTGAIARTMIKALRANNGTMTETDLTDYQVRIRQPSQITYRNHTLHSSSAPASGIIALSALKILEGYPDVGLPSAINLTTHRLVESFRFAYGQRTLLGDPLYVSDLDSYQASILDPNTTSTIRSRITDDRTQNVSYYNPDGLEVLDTPGTSHLVSADSSGLALSLTTTVNLLFGSKLIVPETGIIMNNEMNDFSIPGVNNAFGFAPSPNNYVRPGARPVSSISPIIADDANGNLVFLTGAAGGSRIITSSALQIWNVLDRRMSAQDALAEPRVHDQLVPDRTELETGYDVGVVAFMRARGHNVTSTGAGSSSAQSIRVDRSAQGQGAGVFEAASEPRQKNSGGFVV
ncbi:Gamma-glutamyltranspeptidase 1 [Sphaceloma murrayae]|uniref:Glutathione hydrolase n=1 Tax=Sphaceloma murrayae TaxID=2082308 RepID=A0A2K1QSK6_9PEZI|nr:Gamma-glutamyltranspeptidase 1 [Sphaceloma murrayae]